MDMPSIHQHLQVPKLPVQPWPVLVGILLMVASLSGLAQTTSNLSKGAFPENWDSHRKLRGQNSDVLAWAHFRDTRPYEYRVCLLVMIADDSLGKTNYWIEEQYSNEKPFKNWNTGVIHYAPAKGELVGRYDMHLRKLDHRPTADEIYPLLEQWMFSFEKDGFDLIEGGLDVVLWKAIFGFEADLGLGRE